MDVSVRRAKNLTVVGLSELCWWGLKTLRRHLEQAIDVNIGNLYRYAGDEERNERIKQGIERGDCTLLAGFITQLLKVHLVPAMNSFQEEEKTIKKVHELSLNLDEDCRIKAQEAKSRKEYARLSCGELGVGIVLLVVAGIYGFEGFSAHKDSYFTAVLVVAGLGIVTYHISSSSATSEKEFRELSELYDKVMSSTSKMLNLTRKLKRDLESVSRKIDSVNRAMEDRKAPSHLVSTFNRLCQTTRLLDTCAYQEELGAVNEDL